VVSGAASRGGCSSGAVMLTGGIDFEDGKSQFCSTPGPVALGKAASGSIGIATRSAGRSQIAVFFFTCSSKV
jgi:hypothetical protein